MEKQSIEDSFRNAFQEAEVRPTSDVWTHIELGIEKDAGNELKKRVVYYRWMAAASILLAVSLVGVGYFTIFKEGTFQNPIALNQERGIAVDGIDREPVLDEQPTSTPVIPSNEASGQGATSSNTQGSIVDGKLRNSTLNAKIESNTDKIGSTKDETLSQKKLIVEKNSEERRSNSTAVLFPAREASHSPQQPVWPKSPLPPLVAQRSYTLEFPKTEPNQIDLLLAEIEMNEKASKKKHSEHKEKLWTSVAMAAGSYNPTNTSSSTASTAITQGNGALDIAKSASLSNQVEASGYSFSSGLSIGGKISDRWIVQGGVIYLTQNSSFRSNAVVVDGANNYSLASLNTVNRDAFNGAIQASSPYMVNSTLKYFNVPLQAGYLIINKAFGWQVQGGISTDFFLQNTLSAEDTGLDKISQNSGDESPYRTVNFSGLVGTEVSYRFGDHYRVAINPGIRYPLQSVYKDEVGVSAAPITFDVGLKFHYIFR